MQILNGLVGAMAAWLLTTGAIVAAILILVAGRHDPDPNGRRILGRWTAIIMFFSVLIFVFAAWSTVNKFVQLIPKENNTTLTPNRILNDFSGNSSSGGLGGGRFNFNQPVERARWEVATSMGIEIGLLALAAGAIFFYADLLRRRCASEANYTGSAAWRSDHVMAYFLSGFAVFIGLFASAASIYGLVRVIFPMLTAAGDHATERRAGLAEFLSMLALVALVKVVFWWNWSRTADSRPAKPAAPAGLPPTAAG